MPPISQDGRWWWDGHAWQSLYSPDGRMKWNGASWVPASEPFSPVSNQPPEPPITSAALEDELGGDEQYRAPPDPSGDYAPVEPSRPMGSSLDWAQGFNASGPTPLAVTTGYVADRPNWLAPSERYVEQPFVTTTDPASESAPPGTDQIPLWHQIQESQKSRVIPIVVAGVVAVLMVGWVVSSAGITLASLNLPFMSPGDEPVAAATPTPGPAPTARPIAPLPQRPADRYLVVMAGDGGRLNSALPAVSESCTGSINATQCRASAVVALTAVRDYRRDLSTLQPAPSCLSEVNDNLMMGLTLYEQGLQAIVAGTEANNAPAIAAAESTFDSGVPFMVTANRLLDRFDLTDCH